jgi:hypothetical protein
MCSATTFTTLRCLLDGRGWPGPAPHVRLPPVLTAPGHDDADQPGSFGVATSFARFDPPAEVVHHSQQAVARGSNSPVEDEMTSGPERREQRCCHHLECEWNRSVAANQPADFVSLDTELVRLDGESPFEGADLVHRSGALVHVKRKGRSSALSYLFATKLPASRTGSSRQRCSSRTPRFRGNGGGHRRGCRPRGADDELERPGGCARDPWRLAWPRPGQPAAARQGRVGGDRTEADPVGISTERSSRRVVQPIADAHEPLT